MMVMKVAALILSLMATTPNRRLANDEKFRVAMAQDFVDAGDIYDVDPLLMVWWFFNESSLRVNAVGAAGEIGICQVHGKSKQICDGIGFDLASQRGQIMCGAALFDINRRYCGDITRGLYRYWGGSCEGTPNIIRKTKWRLKKYEKIMDQFD